MTVNELLDLAIEDLETHGRAYASVAKCQVAKLRKSMGNVEAKAITYRRIEKYKQRRRKYVQPKTINNELSLLNKAYRLGVALELVPRVPIIRFYPVGSSNARQGFLEPAQVEAISRNLPRAVDDVVRFAFATGWRRREVLLMRWADIGDEWITCPAPNSKNRRAKRVPLKGQIAEIIERQKPQRRQWLWLYEGRRIIGFRHAWNEACKEAGLEGTLFHDLRRSFARHARLSGVSETVVMALGGWRSRTMFDRYQIVNEDDLLAATEAMDETRGKAPSNT